MKLTTAALPEPKLAAPGYTNALGFGGFDPAGEHPTSTKLTEVDWHDGLWHMQNGKLTRR